MKRIIVTNDPDQQFAISISGTRVTMRLRYCPYAQRWSFDMARDDAWIVRGRRIVTGVDLLRATSLASLGHLFAHAESPGAVPDRAGLSGGAVRLYFADAA